MRSRIGKIEGRGLWILAKLVLAIGGAHERLRKVDGTDGGALGNLV